MQIRLYTYLQKQLINNDNNQQKQVYKYVWFKKKKKTHTQIYSDGQPVTMVTANNEGKK